MKDVKKVKCKNCGFLNVDGSLKCGNCHKPIKNYISCPKCAKKNKLDSKKCVGCGFNFERKERSIFFNFGISILLVAFLAILLFLNHSGAVKNISRGFKIIAIISVVIVFVSTLTYGKNEINKFEAEEVIVDNKRFRKLKRISEIAVIIGFIIAFVGLAIFYFVK